MGEVELAIETVKRKGIQTLRDSTAVKHGTSWWRCERFICRMIKPQPWSTVEEELEVKKRNNERKLSHRRRVCKYFGTVAREGQSLDAGNQH